MESANSASTLHWRRGESRQGYTFCLPKESEFARFLDPVAAYTFANRRPDFPVVGSDSPREVLLISTSSIVWGRITCVIELKTSSL